MRDDAYHQVMLDRMREVEEALERAESGKATPEDWNLIRWECGLSRKDHVNHSEREQRESV